MPRMRVGIVGAGIVGLAHAWSAAERGHRVTVLERSPRATGASIRNFGMVWPIGQPAGGHYQTALRSRERWLQLAQLANLWVHPCGSIHLAHEDDEWAVLQEFHAQSGDLGVDCTLLSREAVLTRSPAARAERLRGGLFSPTELCVNPPEAIRALPLWLRTVFHVDFAFETAITKIEPGLACSSDGRRWEFDRLVIGGGADLATLFPDVFAKSGMRLCKLQMSKTLSQPGGWRLGPHLASGLTLRHYRNFEVCPSLAQLKARIAAETPELDRFGIHVMASQNNTGSVILGDSHEYDSEIEPFDKSQIDELILRELQKIIELPDWTIEARWHGVYAKSPRGPVFEAEPLPNIHVRTGLGGAGMTMAFGLAERDWSNWT